MVVLLLKKGDENQFLHSTSVSNAVDDVVRDVATIFNGRLKIQRICSEMEFLADHGISLSPNMQGLTDEQIQELKLKDEWEDKCSPSGGWRENKDKLGRRNGRAPTEKLQEVLKKTLADAKAKISKDQVTANVFVTHETIKDALDELRGAVMIVYPMGLPLHDPIRMEMENREDLEGTHAAQEIIEESQASLWFSGKELLRGKKLQDYVGKNDKTKVTIKIQKKGQGAPAREPVVSEEEQKKMMAHYYRRQEELKKLETEDESHMDSAWADNNQLKRQFQGLADIKWKPR